MKCTALPVVPVLLLSLRAVNKSVDAFRSSAPPSRHLSTRGSSSKCSLVSAATAAAAAAARTKTLSPHVNLMSSRSACRTPTTLLYESAAAAEAAEPEGEPSSSIAGGGGGTATVRSEIFNLVKAVVGAGVLTLPAGIATYGDAPGAAAPACVLIALIGAMSGYGFGLIGRVCALTGAASYRDAWRESVGSETSWIPAVSVTCKTLFAVLAYSMILGDTGRALAVSAGFAGATTAASLVAVTVALLLPLCLLKNLSSLAPFSLVGSLGMLYTAAAMSVRYFGGAYALPAGRFATDLPPAFRPSFGTVGAAGVWSAKTSILLGMLSTAYMAHFNAPKFYTELKNNTVPRYLQVVGASFGISIALIAAIAATGFLTFGGACSGLILNNYSTRDGLMGLSRIAVAVSLVFSYPLAFVGARDGILDLFQVKDRSAARLNALTVGMLAAITVLALIIPDVSFVLAFAGATLGNGLIYIFPGIMFRGAVKKLKEPTKLQKAEVKVALTSALVGTGLGIMGAIKAVQSVL